MLQLERKHDVRAATPAQYIKERILEVADNLNRAGLLAARVELANEALCRLAELCYAQDTDGRLANVDQATGRIRIPLPWGRVGWKKWKGLRYHEGLTLRRILLARQREYEVLLRERKKLPRPPLYVYDAPSRGWCINLEDYPTFEAAKFWLKREGVTLAEWRGQ